MSGYKFDCPQYVDFTKPFSGDEADALDDFFGGKQLKWCTDGAQLRFIVSYKLSH